MNMDQITSPLWKHNDYLKFTDMQYSVQYTVPGMTKTFYGGHLLLLQIRKPCILCSPQ